MSEEKLSFETLQLFEENIVGTTPGVTAAPVHQTLSYVFYNSDHASSLREYLFKNSK